MKKIKNQKFKGSAMVYALIVVSLGLLLTLGLGITNILNIQTTNQQIDGVQAYFAAESSQELAYTARRYLSGMFNLDLFPGGSGPATIDNERRARARFDLIDLDDTIHFQVQDTWSIPSRSADIVTMDFRVYATPLATDTNTSSTFRQKPDYPPDASVGYSDRDNFTLETDGYSSASQKRIRAFVGADNSGYLPWIISDYIP